MQKQLKSRVIPAAMAVVVLIGVCSDFRLGSSGDTDSQQGKLFDIAASGAITYASEGAALIDGSGLKVLGGYGKKVGAARNVIGEDPLITSLFSLKNNGEDHVPAWDNSIAGTGEDGAFGNTLGTGMEGNGDGDSAALDGSGDMPDGAGASVDPAKNQGGDSQDPAMDQTGEPSDPAMGDATDPSGSLGDTPDSLPVTDPSLPEEEMGTDGVGSDDELYLPGEDGTVVDEEPAPEFYTQGISHSSVADIQQRLMDLGFMDYSEPTMYYGSITAKAVEQFQRQHDLKQDGIIGPETKALLFSDEAKYYLAKAGMDGDDIKRIQRRLYEMGYLAKSEYVTGHFGDMTEAAVKQMQQNNGLAADGKVGHDTLEMLYSEEAKANIISYGDKSDVVLACQERLKELGYLTTKPDGQYGNDTVAAVKQFQSRNDLVVDGFLGPTTMVVLNGSGAVANGMMIGESGDTVKRVQELLARYGYMSSSSCTGYFGEVTEEAVKEFQRKNGLLVDGNVGMKTMAKLTGGDAVKANGQGGTSTGKDTSSSGNKTSSSSGNKGGSSSTVSTGSASVSALLQVAKSKLGKPYVYGAKGPNAFDCSGYVYWCLNQVGIKQSYITSYGWRSVGKYQKVTSFSSIKAGDIVVVKGHVGIAAGNGMVYDASSSSGKIVYRSLGAWWKKNFICAWRIF